MPKHLRGSVVAEISKKVRGEPICLIEVGYADSITTASGFELNGNGYNLLATYDLSKRTYLYTSYDRTSLEKGAVGTIGTDVASRLIAGVVHLF